MIDVAALRILVVDDQPDVLSAIGAQLRQLGYRVLTALGADSALRQLQSTAVDVILTDYHMAPIGGHAWIERLVAMSAGAPWKVVVMSGAGRDLKLPVPLLMKPFSGDELAAALAQP